jgi:hypothetical protein
VSNRAGQASIKRAIGRLFIEHVRSERPGRARLQEWLTPIWRRIAANCHLNRRTTGLLVEGGFDAHDLEHVNDRGPCGNVMVAGAARIKS